MKRRAEGLAPPTMVMGDIRKKRNWSTIRIAKAHAKTTAASMSMSRRFTVISLPEGAGRETVEGASGALETSQPTAFRRSGDHTVEKLSKGEGLSLGFSVPPHDGERLSDIGL